MSVLLGLAVRYLVIVVALSHASLGVRPRLTVIYGLNGVDNINELECIDTDNFRRSRATYTFRDPATEQLEYNVTAEGTSYQFTIQPNNESLVSCTIDDFKESDQIMVAGM